MHSIDAAYCYRCRTLRGLCVCVLGTPVRYAKTAEPIEMSFGGLLVWARQRNHAFK